MLGIFLFVFWGVLLLLCVCIRLLTYLRSTPLLILHQKAIWNFKKIRLCTVSSIIVESCCVRIPAILEITVHITPFEKKVPIIFFLSNVRVHSRSTRVRRTLCHSVFIGVMDCVHVYEWLPFVRVWQEMCSTLFIPLL